MKTIAYEGGSPGLALSDACSHLPTATHTTAETEVGTKTGMVRNIVINETIHPRRSPFEQHDEIRWINQRRIRDDHHRSGYVMSRRAEMDFPSPWAWGFDNSTTWPATKRLVSALRESARSNIQYTYHPMPHAA